MSEPLLGRILSGVLGLFRREPPPRLSIGTYFDPSRMSPEARYTLDPVNAHLWGPIPEDVKRRDMERRNQAAMDEHARQNGIKPFDS